MRKFRAGLALAVCLSAAEAVGAQQTALFGLGYGLDSEDAQQVEQAQAQTFAAGSEPTPAEAPSPRQMRLQSVEYDRRPSAMLAAWSTPPAKPSEPAVAVEPQAAPVEEPAPEGETPEQAALRLAAKAEQQAALAKARAEAAKQAAEAQALESEIRSLQRNVTLGDWAAVRAYFASLTEAERKVGFERLLQSLQNGPQQRPQVPQQGQLYVEKNQFAPRDVVGISVCGPAQLLPGDFAALGRLLRMALDAGYQLESFLAETQVLLDDPQAGLDRRKLALMLINANEPRALATLLPSLEQAQAADDREGLNLIARYCLGMHAKDSEARWLEQAWAATQAVLAIGEVEESVKQEALRRAVEIAPKIQSELGQAWLDESFSARPERGMEILAAIGSSASLSLAAEPLDNAKREKLLELQTTAAKALLAAAPQLATQWSQQLELLAGNWLREAGVSYLYDESTTLAPQMQRDAFGNFFYRSWGGGMRNNAPTAISTSKILEMRPNDTWLAHLDPTLQPRFQMLFAELLLKVGEEAQAFPYIESLATSLPSQSKSLVDEFLRVWTRNHNPNSSNNTNEYMFFYGFEERASGIPLTRSKQARNLEELAGWVARLRKLPVELDDTLVAQAFTTAHSSAEVFRLESIEQIFGPASEVKPATMAQILQRMRQNLVMVWRDPALQADKQTKRRQQDIEAEVLRGYELGAATVETLLAAHPQSWELCLLKAALAHDENNYRAELAKDPAFSLRRQQAFELFAQAAQLYAAQVPQLGLEQESTEVFDLWFYAALGACDLKQIKAESLLAGAQIGLIREALLGLPGESAARHLSMFAGALFTRMSNVAPAIKFRYVREGLEITGDHKLASEARKVLDYYSDLVTEIQLRTCIDGSDRIGHDQPFGLAVDIRHTREIERESGGFAKYLQNQNSASFGFNYGRPLEDYRDKFEDSARTALNEHFEVISLTFNDPQTLSKADPEYGWRVTPYAYLLLKPRSAAVDRVPALRLDLDFLDTTGYAVLPVESPALLIDAMDAAGEPRPFENLAVTQTLDERQAQSGKLVLEVKATARGLVPKFEEILELAPPDFEIASLDDQGVAVVKFEEDGEGIESERSWTITMLARQGLAEAPASFRFGQPRLELASNEHFRFVDADLLAVGETIELERSYAEPSRSWLWWLPAGAAVLLGGWWLARRGSASAVQAQARFEVPLELNPFTVIGLLQNIQAHNHLAQDEHSELQAQIQALEQHYFGQPTARVPDLGSIARDWVARASQR